jgi:hypothetical protein
MQRPQFSLKTLLWLMLVVAAFVGGIQFERERRRRADDAAAMAAQAVLRARVSAGMIDAMRRQQVPDGEAGRRMPTFRPRIDRMPTLRESLATPE